MFRSKRNALVKRLWKHRISALNGCGRHEINCPVENCSDFDVKSVAQSMLKRLKESQLEMLLRAVESQGADGPGCVLVPHGDLRLGRKTAPSNVLCCQLWRWHDLRNDFELKRLSWCDTINDPLYMCCNPYHWTRLQIPESPPPPYTRFPQNKLYEEEQTESGDPVSTETGGGNQYGSCQNMACSSSNNSNPVGGGVGGSNSTTTPWCTMAYWELRTRVGRLFSVRKTSVNVFADLPHGDGFCLETINQCHQTKSESILRTRSKIGFGINLTREEKSVWLYNRSQSLIFVNSPTLDSPGTRTLTVHKICPGYSIKIFDFEKATYYRHLAKTKEVEPVQKGPFDPNAVRISFAKGWGPKYSRQFVTSCPCWLEVFLAEPPR